MAISKETKNLIRPEVDRLELIKKSFHNEKKDLKAKIDLVDVKLADVDTQLGNLKADLNG